MYEFNVQLDKGEQAEAELDTFFSMWFRIQKATQLQQKRGIDRVFRTRAETFTVEYKSDWKASETGNAFVETISVDTNNTPGWAYTSQADVLVYSLPIDRLAYWILFDDLRRRLPRWLESYQNRKIPNKDYYTHGILVPLAEFGSIARRRFEIRC